METFHQKLKDKLDKFAHDAYRVSRSFPHEEKFGLTSQFRRAALSVALNYVEGKARQHPKEFKHFVRISFGSLKETQYLINFLHQEKYLNQENFSSLNQQANEIGAMLFSILRN
jgi:four helix bundle protein